jgi:murein DD-endopeptidase MepM/ murein hydrolase activator NlpD
MECAGEAGTTPASEGWQGIGVLNDSGDRSSGGKPDTVQLRRLYAETLAKRQAASRRAAVLARSSATASAIVPPTAQAKPSTDAARNPLDSAFETEPIHHRWLLTTCVAGIAGTLVFGSAILGIFGENVGPPDAYAAVQRATITGEGNAEFRSHDTLNLAAAQPPASGEMVIPERDLSGNNNYPQITADELPYGDGKTVVLDAEIASAEQENANITTISKTAPPEPVDETFALAKAGSLVDALVDRGVSQDVAQSLVDALEPVFPSVAMKEGTQIELTLDRQQDFYGRDVTFPVELSFQPGPNETIKVESDEDGHFTAAIDGAAAGAKSRYAEIDHFHTKAQVGSSLYASAKDNKIPDYIVAELTRVFSYDVDFQRQVKASDTYEVFYGNPLTGTSSKRKVLHYAKLILSGKTKAYFRYTPADGQTDYFDENGQSATKSLLKTPVSGAKITSGFGMRIHPLLGYSKMHTGIDFGVPYGTPIRAAGAGVVELAGRNGAYGVTVEIKHNSKYETLYAHMSKLAAGVVPGVRVNQGQVIGYVGATGRATGPHLHYEVRINNNPVNPTRIASTGGRQLGGSDLMKFRQLKQKVLAMMQLAPSATQVAQAGQ